MLKPRVTQCTCLVRVCFCNTPKLQPNQTLWGYYLGGLRQSKPYILNLVLFPEGSPCKTRLDTFRLCTFPAVEHITTAALWHTRSHSLKNRRVHLN